MDWKNIDDDDDEKGGLNSMLRAVKSAGIIKPFSLLLYGRRAERLLHVAEYNIGRAYYEGSKDVTKSDEKALSYWLKAASEGVPEASGKAQSALGLFYATPEHLDVPKVLFWHTIAAANHNLESLGAIGYMLLEGIGVQADYQKALPHLKNASERGNVFAMGNLIALFYRNKMYTSAVELATNVVHLLDDVRRISTETDCMQLYIRKGISTANFYLAKCLQGCHVDLSLNSNLKPATEYYLLSYNIDQETYARLRSYNHGLE